MRRHELVDWLFWIVLFGGLISVFGLYQCTDWEYFLKGVSFIGLGFDAIGALLLVLSEIRSIQSFMWDERASLIRKLEDSSFEREDANEPWLVPKDVEFQYLEDITRDRRSISRPHEEGKKDIDYFSFFPDRVMFAYGSNKNKVELGPPEIVERWVRDRIHELTRRKTRPYAVVILFIGFGCQLISYGLQNL